MYTTKDWKSSSDKKKAKNHIKVKKSHGVRISAEECFGAHRQETVYASKKAYSKGTKSRNGRSGNKMKAYLYN